MSDLWRCDDNMTDFGNCDHEMFQRVGELKAVYECADCGNQIVIPSFRWVGEAAINAHTEGDE